MKLEGKICDKNHLSSLLYGQLSDILISGCSILPADGTYVRIEAWSNKEMVRLPLTTGGS